MNVPTKTIMTKVVTIVATIPMISFRRCTSSCCCRYWSVYGWRLVNVFVGVHRHYYIRHYYIPPRMYRFPSFRNVQSQSFQSSSFHRYDILSTNMAESQKTIVLMGFYSFVTTSMNVWLALWMSINMLLSPINVDNNFDCSFPVVTDIEQWLFLPFQCFIKRWERMRWMSCIVAHVVDGLDSDWFV